MIIIQKVAFATQLSFICAFLFAFGNSLLVDYSNGWDGIAGVLGALILGTIMGAIGSILTLKRLTDKQLKTANLICSIGVLFVLAFIYYRSKSL